MLHTFSVKSSVHNYTAAFVDDAPTTLASCLSEGDFVIVDKNVLELYERTIGALVRGHGHVVLDATEEKKSYLGVVSVLEHLIENGFRKNNRLVAIGGGITQDVTAFVASILYRGVAWSFFPTTLLAMGDSCIGSKTAINFGRYKNQVGNFYPPHQIFIDMTWLDTLPERDMKSGLGEMLHYYIVSGERDYERFVREYVRALTDRETLRGVIERSLEIKKKIIELDEFDRNERQVLNYGHSFGHALECVTHHKIPHGIGVVFGMDMANFISMKLGFISKELFEDLSAFFSKVCAGFDMGDSNFDTFMDALGRDKKNVGSDLGLILMRGVGQTFKTVVRPDRQFREWMGEYFAARIH
ncbi:MAG: 3-dehydroquinate synthase [bacterium]|nr:3-dehydroquinate synthase [bacterium]